MDTVVRGEKFKVSDFNISIKSNELLINKIGEV